MKWFNYSEFDSPDAPGSGEKHMDKDFLSMLDQARTLAGVPFKINSGYRTAARNKAVGGVKGSSHTKGQAVDIHCSDSRARAYIVGALMGAGFNRIGIAATFIHVDNDPEKPEDVIWLY